MPPDPFDLLGLPARFDLDRADIESRFLGSVSTLHPDVASDNAGAGECSALLNDARAILADPERRAAALLTRLGGPRPEQEKSLPPEFLSEILEIRENVESALASRDPAEIERWRAWAVQRRRQFVAWAGGAFSSLGDPPDSGALRDIRRGLNAWRYIERLVEQLHA